MSLKRLSFPLQWGWLCQSWHSLLLSFLLSATLWTSQDSTRWSSPSLRSAWKQNTHETGFRAYYENFIYNINLCLCLTLVDFYRNQLILNHPAFMPEKKERVSPSKTQWPSFIWKQWLTVLKLLSICFLPSRNNLHWIWAWCHYELFWLSNSPNDHRFQCFHINRQ